MYPNVSGFSPFQNPSFFGAGGVDFSRLKPYPGQIQGLGLQTAQINLGTAQIGNRFGYTTDLTNPRTGELAQMKQEFDLAMRRFKLEKQFSQVAVDRFLKVEEAARLETQILQTANQTLQREIESGTLDATALENKRSELTLNNEKLQQLEQLPQLVLQESQAQQQLLQQLEERQQRIKDLSTGIANTLGEGLRESLNLIINGSENRGLALENIVVKMLNQIIDQLLYITVIQPFVKGATDFLQNIFTNMFADGGIMTQDGPMPLKRYAYGGIANSPQLAMFGEGSKPEAYVPLPDGRSIPVTMRSPIKNSDNKTTINNISVTVSSDSTQSQGSDSTSRRLGEELALKIQQEIIRQQRPGAHYRDWETDRKSVV